MIIDILFLLLLMGIIGEILFFVLGAAFHHTDLFTASEVCFKLLFISMMTVAVSFIVLLVIFAGKLFISIFI